MNNLRYSKNHLKAITTKKIHQMFPDEGTIYEAILTLRRKSICKEKDVLVPNASAIGVIRKDAKLNFMLFRGSNGFDAIDANPVVGLNIPNNPGDPHIFYKAALSGHGNDEHEFEEDDYEFYRNGIREVPFLKECRTWLYMGVTNIEIMNQEDDLGSVRVKKISCDLSSLEIIREKQCIGTAYTRSDDNIMEALIAASRYLAVENRDELEKAERYLAQAENKEGKNRSKIVEQKIVEKIRGKLYSSSSSITE